VKLEAVEVYRLVLGYIILKLQKCQIYCQNFVQGIGVRSADTFLKLLPSIGISNILSSYY